MIMMELWKLCMPPNGFEHTDYQVSVQTNGQVSIAPPAHSFHLSPKKSSQIYDQLQYQLYEQLYD